jgi:hypothetical protein
VGQGDGWALHGLAVRGPVAQVGQQPLLVPVGVRLTRPNLTRPWCATTDASVGGLQRQHQQQDGCSEDH